MKFVYTLDIPITIAINKIFLNKSAGNHGVEYVSIIEWNAISKVLA